MRNFLSCLLLLFALQQGFCQASFIAKLPPLDKSPLDITYFPDNYPMLKTQEKLTEPLMARIIYSRPQKNNRVIFGDLIEYGKVWRLGANEATEIEFFKDASISGKKINKGRYTLYAIPNSDHWTIILNKDTDTWGAFIYDPKKDILRVDEPVQQTPTTVDIFTIHFDKTDQGANLMMAWDGVNVVLPISIK